MASMYELSNLSWMAYDWKKNSFYRWQRIRMFGPRSGEGFYSELYYNSVKKEAVMSIRGTDFEKKDTNDFLSDAQLGIGKVPSQHRMAKAAYNEFRDYLKRIGSGNVPSIGRYNYLFYFNKKPFLHLRATGDLISRWGKHIGEVKDVYVNNWGDDKIVGASRHFAQHSIENMTKALGSLYWYMEDIKKEQIHGTTENLILSQNKRKWTRNDK